MHYSRPWISLKGHREDALYGASLCSLFFDHKLTLSGRRALRRIMFPPAPKYHNAPRIHFADVILADILTSFAKVFVDIYFCLCQLLASGGSLLFVPAQTGWTRWIAPTIMR